MAGRLGNQKPIFIRKAEAEINTAAKAAVAIFSPLAAYLIASQEV
jgi:hypothetical protein